MILEGRGHGEGSYIKEMTRDGFSELRSSGGEEVSWEGSVGRAEVEQAEGTTGCSLRARNKLDLLKAEWRQRGLHWEGVRLRMVQEQK